jgi:hypothetical protein
MKYTNKVYTFLKSNKTTLLILCVCLLINVCTFAQRNITIGSSATTNGTWSGADPDVFTPNADNATILNTDIQTRLATKGVTITTAGGGSQAGDVTFTTTVAAAPTVSSKTFTVTAAGAITINAASAITLTPASSASTITGTNVTFTAVSITSASAITTTGGVNTSGIGGAGGAINLSVTSGNINITSGALTTNGGANTGGSASGGAAGTITLSSTSGSITSQDLNSVGGASSAAAGGIGGALSITAASATAITLGNIATTGGAAGGNFAGGVGGAVTIADHTGSTTITSITAKGGASGIAVGAAGGIVRINATTPTGSDVTIGNIDNSGSSPSSFSNNGGAAGAITIKSSTGFVNCTGTISSIGGSAQNGTGGAGGALLIASNTNLTIGGNVTVAAGPNINNNGGGGTAGSITLTSSNGNVTTANLTTSGGAGLNAAGSAGGAISITAANASAINIGAVTTSGGSATAAAAGSAGNVTIADHSGTTSITSITANGGSVTGGGNGGNGGAISINATTPIGGSVTIGVISNTGGSPSASGGTGGNGGSSTIKSSSGFVNCTSTVTSTGGNGNNGAAGIGGALTIVSSTDVTLSGTVNLTGGSGTQNFINGGAGGAINITSSSGNVATAALTTSGGPVVTWGVGGAGGAIAITANSATTFAVGVITTSGGVAGGNDNAGGAGGAITISASSAALTSTSAIITNGGNGGLNNSFGGTGGAITISSASISITGGVAISTTGGTKSGTGTSTAGAVSLTGTAGVKLTADITTTATTTNGTITINDGSSTITSGGVNDGQTANVFNCGSVNFTKTGTGNMALGGINTYTGNTVISAGTLTISAANRISTSSLLQLNGGTFSTGATTGFNQTFNTLNLNANSTISLGTGSHTLTLGNCSGVAWAGSTLTINGWTGAGGASGTSGKIIVGAGGLTAGQLAKITFTGYSGCSIVGTEVVPTTLVAISYYSKSTGNLDVLSNWGTATDGTGTAPTDFVSNNCTYNIRNNATPTIGAAWTVAGTSSKIVVGDGTAACNFTIPSGFVLTTTSPVVIDVSANATLTIANTSIPTLGTLNATSKVDYAVTAGGQTITSATYGNLSLSNTSGPQTAGGNLTVNGIFLTTVGGTLDMGTSAILSGTLSTITNGGTIKTSVPTATSATPIPSGKTWGGTVEYARSTGVQTVMAGTYNNLTSSNTSGTQTTSASIVVNGTLTTTSGGTLDLGASSVLSGTLSSISNSGTLKTSVITTTSATPFPSGKTWGGTVEYAATTGVQTVMAGTYNNLTASNTSGSQTASGNIIVNGTLTTTNGGTLDMSTYTLSGTLGTITNGGIISTSNTSTLPFLTGKTWGGTIKYAATAGGQTIVAGTYATLKVLNTSGTNTAGGNFSASGVFTTTSGGTLSIPCAITITTSSTFTNAGIIIGAVSGSSWSRIVNSISIANSGTIGSSSTSLAVSSTITGGVVINNGVNVLQSSAQAAVCGSTSPTLIAAVGASVDAAFDITYTDNPAWRAAITSITIGGVTLTSGFTVTAGKITLTPSTSSPASLLQTNGSKSIIISATGYVDASVTQAIAAGIANKLGISLQPLSTAISGSVFVTQPVVIIQDQYGNTSNSTANVVATVGSGGWTIGGTTTIAGVSGISTFTNLTATKATAVSGATITFTSPGLTSVTSSPFTLYVYACSSSCTPVIGATNYTTTAINQEYCLASGTWTGNITFSHTGTKVCIAGTWNPSTTIVSSQNSTLIDIAGTLSAPAITLNAASANELRNELLGYVNITTTNGGLGGTNLQTTGSTITNYGTYITNGFANSIGGLLDNKTGGVLVDTSALTMYFGGIAPNTTNNGKIRKNGGTIEVNMTNNTFTNTGTIWNQSLGNLTVNGANFTNTGSLTYQGITSLIVGTATVVSNSGTWTNGYTGATADVFVMNNLTTFNNTGTFTNNKGNVVLYNGATLTNAANSTFTTNNGNVIFTNTATITNNGTFNITGTGGLSAPCNSASFTNNNKMTIQNGNLNWDNNANVFTNNGVVTLSTAGTSVIVGNGGSATLTNNGKIDAPNMSVGINGTLQNNCLIQLSQNFTLNNAGIGGVFGPSTAAGYVGKFSVMGVTTWTNGTFGAAGTSIDFCDLSGGLQSGWDSDGGHIPVAGGTYTHCLAAASGGASCTTALPISLLNFSVTCKGNNTNELLWVTGSEINNDKFYIERSVDGIKFELIHIIPGAGNSNRRKDYTINDFTSLSNINYYRLTQVDYDGKHETFPVVSVICDPDILPAKLIILPNPIINNEITFKLFGLHSTDVRITIIDAIGRVIYQEISYRKNNKSENKQTTTINLSSTLAQGVYFMQVQSGFSNLIEKFFVK